MNQLQRVWRRWWWALALVVLLGGYWLLPISGQVVVVPGDEAGALLWPRMELDPPAPQPGQEVTLRVTDAVAWTHVLLTVDGRPAQSQRWPIGPEDALVWEWTFVVPADGSSTLVFYRDCDTGCVERGRRVIGAERPAPPPHLLPTKLGVVFPNLERDWNGHSGWAVELTYAQLSAEAYWGIDDLAARVHQATNQGLRVLVRVDYHQGQSLPPADDYLALTEYLQYLERLARDDRLQDVYGYIIGSGYNSLGSNALAPDHPVTPAWYARLFNGYGEEVTHSDNAVQVIRAENPGARVLVGPVQPWNTDQSGDRTYRIDAPWLNYMNTLVALVEEAARAKAETGIPLTAPDGFAVQAPGRPGAPELAGQDGAEEPRVDMRRPEWDGAQAGFRVYRDWLGVVNAYPTTQGLPVYITSSNTYTPDEGVPPAQNYPQGWLTMALDVINDEPQVPALCWFLDDFPHDPQWDYFSLTEHPGRLIDAAEEFDALLERVR